MPDLNLFDVDLDGDVAGSHSGRPWREAPLLHSEAVSQTGRGYGESGVGFLSPNLSREGKKSTPGGSTSYIYSRTCIRVSHSPKGPHNCPCGA